MATRNHLAFNPAKRVAGPSDLAARLQDGVIRLERAKADVDDMIDEAQKLLADLRVEEKRREKAKEEKSDAPPPRASPQQRR